MVRFGHARGAGRRPGVAFGRSATCPTALCVFAILIDVNKRRRVQDRVAICRQCSPGSRFMVALGFACPLLCQLGERLHAGLRLLRWASGSMRCDKPLRSACSVPCRLPSRHAGRRIPPVPAQRVAAQEQSLRATVESTRSMQLGFICGKSNVSRSVGICAPLPNVDASPPAFICLGGCHQPIRSADDRIRLPEAFRPGGVQPRATCHRAPPPPCA